MTTCTHEGKVFIVALPLFSMAKADLEAGLKSLRKSLQQIKSLLAWEQLKQSEARPGQPPSFTLNDPIETDLRNEYSFFLATILQIHTILNSSSIAMPQVKQQRVRAQLAKIERQLYNLNLQQRRFS